MRWSEVQSRLEAEGLAVTRDLAWRRLKSLGIRPPQNQSGFGVYTMKHVRVLRDYFKTKRTYRKRRAPQGA